MFLFPFLFLNFFIYSKEKGEKWNGKTVVDCSNVRHQSSKSLHCQSASCGLLRLNLWVDDGRIACDCLDKSQPASPHESPRLNKLLKKVISVESKVQAGV